MDVYAPWLCANHFIILAPLPTRDRNIKAAHYANFHLKTTDKGYIEGPGDCYIREEYMKSLANIVP